MSDMITLPETEEGKIVYIVETMRDSIFRALDNKQQKSHKAKGNGRQKLGVS